MSKMKVKFVKADGVMSLDCPKCCYSSLRTAMHCPKYKIEWQHLGQTNEGVKQ